MPPTARTARGFDLFRIAGVQVAVDYSWIVIFLLVLWSLSAGYFPARMPGYGPMAYFVTGLVATLLFFASVLLHELSHAAVANRLGQEVRRITLFIFGGMAHLSQEAKDPASEFKIAAVGPLTSFVLGGGFLFLAGGLETASIPPLGLALFQYLGFINVALAVFNLLPGFPLDGGRLLRALFWHRSGNLRRATARAGNWGAGIATGLMVLGALQIFAGALLGGLWLIFIAMFLRAAAQAGVQNLVADQALRSVDVREIMIDDPTRIPSNMKVDEAVERYFLRHGHGGYPVGEDGRVTGLLSLAEVRQCPPEERSRRTVRDIMRPLDESIRVRADTPVSEALRRMSESGNGRLLVMTDSRLDGLITRDRVMRFLQVRTELEETTV